MRTTRRGFAILMVGLCFVAPRWAYGIWGVGDIVLDPSNLAQNALTATRTALSNANEARLILQNVEQFAQQAKHLVQIPMNLVNEINDAMMAYTRLLNEGRSAVNQAQWTVQQYEHLFASGWQGNGNFMQIAQSMLGKVREAGRLATHTGELYNRVSGQQRGVNRLLLASQSAPGSLAAQQATNQLIGTLADQQANIQVLLAANNELQTSWIMSQVVAAEQAQAHGMSQVIDPAKYRAYVPGQGPRLP